ncbi:hypothetical protein BDW62DRAFT_207852 [Aspergillus aurantiobrunneus]
MSTPSSGDTSISQPRRHIVKACEGCRHQKIRCNGESPCERCARLSLPCTVRTVARQRRPPALRKSPPKRPSQENLELIRAAFRPVRITDEATGRTAVYGPTSTVALLHLLASNSPSNPAVPVKNLTYESLVNNINSSISIDGPGLHPFLSQPYVPSPTLGLSLTPPLCLSTIPNELLQFFLNSYLSTAWSILPMQTPAQLGGLFASVCMAFSQNSPPPALYPILLYQLAMGSLSTAQGELADLLVQESDLFISTGSHLTDALNLQLNILMIIYIQYCNETGRFERAYSLLGHVAPKVYAAGFHLEPRRPGITRLIRSLLSAESFICIALGRPPLLGPSVEVCTENESADSRFFSGLFAIISHILFAQKNPVADLNEQWDSIWTTHDRLTSFWEEYEPLLRSLHTDPYRPWNIVDTLALKGVLYEYAVITNFKPVLLYTGHKKSPPENAAWSASSQTDIPTTSLASKTDSDKTPSAAGEHILASAKNIIATIAEVRQRGSMAKDLPMNSFFLEVACTSLIAYGVWHDNPAAVWDSIDLGVHCIEELQYQRVAVQRLAAVKAAIAQSGLRRQ